MSAYDRSVRTIPTLFRAAVDAVPDKVWLCTDAHEYTYAQALEQVERAAAALRAEGVQPGDRVLVVARNTAEYLFVWFALMEVGAIQVPVNPASAPAELDGFRRQVEPRFVVDDGNVAALFTGPADGRGPAAIDETDVAVMIPTSGTTGRSKLVMQTHLAYVMAGEGFPYWMQLTADDRLMTSLPLFHINAPAYSTLGSLVAAREPRAAARASRRARSSTRRAASARPSSTRSARCSRSSCASPRAPTTPTTRCASATPGRRPSGSARRRSKRASGSRSCAATRCRSRRTG